MQRKTPRRVVPYGAEAFTPPVQASLSRELKQALHERNLLTAKSRKKICGMLDGSTETINRTGSEADKRLQFRRQAIQEILTSERSYIAQLDVLMKYFVRPLKTRPDLIGTEQYQAVFGQVDMIYSLNAELLSELEADLDNVARAFKRIAPFFKLYSVYAFDYNRSQLILQELTDKNAAFKRFLEANESRPEVQRKLISLLIAPIQRVPRYRLLLQQVILYASPSDADFRALQESIREVESTVNHLNGVIQDQENTQALLDLQNSLVSRQPNIVQPSRKVIREGILQKMSSSGSKLRRHCVLMSDIFMYCKCLKERAARQLVVGALQCCCIFPLKKCRVSEIFPGTFKLTCQGDGIILCADTVANGRAWLAAIKDTIDVHVQCRKTIRKGSSKRAPIRRKDVKNFEANASVTTGAKRRPNEFDSVLKCTTDSDTDLDSTAVTATCFKAINPQQMFRRKRKAAEMSAASVRFTPTKPTNTSQTFSPILATTSPPHTPPIRHWFQPGVGSISALAQNSQMMLTSTPDQQRAGNAAEDFDPTYGMAAYAHHKSIGELMAEDGGNNAADRKWTPKASTTAAEWTDDIENKGPAVKRKRVHFNVVDSERQHSVQPYQFTTPARPSAEVGREPTLRSRIAGFFASLF